MQRVPFKKVVSGRPTVAVGRSVGGLAFSPPPSLSPPPRERAAFASIGVHKKRAILLSLLTTHVGKKEIKKRGRKEGKGKTFAKAKQGGLHFCLLHLTTAL